jgi:hypothetical protein
VVVSAEVNWDTLLTGITCWFTADAALPKEEMNSRRLIGYIESAKSEAALISRTGYCAVLRIFLHLDVRSLGTCKLCALYHRPKPASSSPDRPRHVGVWGGARKKPSCS